jgi:transposase-like protein
MTAVEHLKHHGGASWVEEAVAMYASGMSCVAIAKVVARNPVTVYRALVRRGTAMRSELRIAVPRRELERSGRP